MKKAPEGAFFIGSFLNEEEIQKEECRNQNTNRPDHIAEETWHLNATLLNNRDCHKVRSIANVGYGSHKDRAHGNRHQRMRIFVH